MKLFVGVIGIVGRVPLPLDTPARINSTLGNVNKNQLNLDFVVWPSPNISPELSLQLEPLNPIFEILPDIHSEYMVGEIQNDVACVHPENPENWADCSFYYGERTQIGFLSAAVWRAGGTTLEEFGTRKGEANGRGDLWMRIRNSSSKSMSYWCEAKHNYIDLKYDDKNVLSAVHVCLESSVRDVKKTTGHPGICLAISFSTLGAKSLNGSQCGERIDRRVQFIMKESTSSDRNGLTADAYFWIGKNSGWRAAWEKSRSFFGVLIAVKCLGVRSE